jgi:hypothetical protein
LAEKFKFEISLSVLNHLGRNLYRNFITVLAEAISNSWDADAKNVWIDIDYARSSFSIKDDGHGMSPTDFQDKFLKIGYSKRKDGSRQSKKNRPYIGAKGIGKLALLSCAKQVTIYTKTVRRPYTGGVINNSGLDKAIKSDVTADQYPLGQIRADKLGDLSEGHTRGTILVFDGMKEELRSSPQHLKKLLALTFKFSLIDPNFNIFVNGEKIGVSDLKDIADATEFLWVINGYQDKFTLSLKSLKAKPISVTTKLNVAGFLATVEKPRNLKITGTDERATVDLFVNGRLREKNVIRHIPTQRLVESYIYGQIHFDTLDREGTDPFTSSREGIIESDAKFQELLTYLKKLMSTVLDKWDDLRLGRDQPGDDENPRITKRARKARELYSLSTSEFYPKSDGPAKDQVDEWLSELRPDAEFNLQAYVDCFLAENLVRKLLEKKGYTLVPGIKSQYEKWKEREKISKNEANVSFKIRKSEKDLYYLDMGELSLTAEGPAVKSTASSKASLWRDSINYKPVRNAVGHTGLLTTVAKTHLSTTFANIRERVRTLLKGSA